MSHLSFLQDLKSIRDYFEINYINLFEHDDTSISIYIKPSDNEGELDFLFTSKINEYDKVIKNYIEKDNDLSITHEILLDEKHRLEKILSLNNSDEVVNFYKPLIVIDKLGLTVGLENFRPDVDGKEYLFKHFIFRKEYIQQLLMFVEKYLLSIINLKRTAVNIKLNNEHKALKIMTEFSYLLEQGLLHNENLKQIQISAIRFKLFEALGLSDAEFARGRNEMFNRMPDNRFKYIETLISDVSNSIEKIPFRKKSNK